MNINYHTVTWNGIVQSVIMTQTVTLFDGLK